MIGNLLFTVFPSPDVDRSRDRFERLFGFPVKFQDGNRWAEFRFPGGARLAIATPEEAGFSGPGAVPVFESDNLDQDIERFKACGLSLVSRRDMGPHGIVVSFESDCGPIQIYSRKSIAQGTN